MSVQRRKLSYWSIEFASGDEHHFDSQLFCRFLNYVDNLSEEDKLFRDEKTTKLLHCQASEMKENKDFASLKSFLSRASITILPIICPAQMGQSVLPTKDWMRAIKS